MTTLAATVRTAILSDSEIGTLSRLRRESILFRQQEGSSGVFLIESGLVKLTRTSSDGSMLILSVAGAHQLVGDECLTPFFSEYFTESACLTDVTGYQISKDHLRRILSNPDLANSLVSYVIARNREYIHKVEMLALRDVEHRILYGLAALALLVKPTSDGAAFPIPMTQAEIASFVGATRETTSTTLSVLKSRRLVSLARRLVTTVHPDILINAANDRMARTRTAS